MKAFPIGGSIFTHTLRSPGLAGLLVGAALLILCLSWITSFGLGRESMMVREAAFGTVLLAAFLASIAAGLSLQSPAGRAFLHESAVRSGSRNAGIQGLCLGIVLIGAWTAAVLLPFVAAAISIFHKNTISSIVSIVCGLSSIVLSFEGARSRLPSAIAPTAVAAAAVLALATTPSVPGSLSMGYLALLCVASSVLVSAVNAAILAHVPGAAGALTAFAAFVLVNMRGALADGNGLTPWALLPDVHGLNPSLAAACPGPVDTAGVAGLIAYTLAAGIALVWMATGIAALRDSTN